MSSHQRYGSGGPYEARVGYSRLVVAGHQAWTAGCTAIVGVDGGGTGGTPDSVGEAGVAGLGDARAQAVAAFAVGLSALERAGFAVTDVVQTRMYVVDIATHAEAVGTAHASLFADVRPASTMVGVAALIDPRLLVEVEIVAVRDRDPAAPAVERA